MNNLVSIILPTRNEELNIKRILTWGLRDAAVMHSPSYKYEAIVVDDSDDKTAMIAEAFGARVIKGKRQGLGQAILDGIEASKGDIVVVMDADGSHNPHAIPGMLRPILEEGADFVVGSRYVKGGGTVGWSLKRKIISRVACLLALPITRVKDATSGFFAFKKSILEKVSLEPTSWKIILEILAKANPTVVKESPIQFEERHAGESKFDRKQMLAYLKHLGKLITFKHQRLIKFGIVGASGGIIHFGLLYSLTEFTGLMYLISALIAVLIATTNNYFLNHLWTFRAEKQHNVSLARGWLKYNVTALASDGLYIGLLAGFTEIAGLWYILSAVVALVIIYVVRFIIVSQWIWGKKRDPDDADYDWLSFYKGNPIQKWWKQSIAKTVWNWIPASSTLLDIGCGASPIITKYPHAIGIDINEDKIKFMKKKLPNGFFVMMPGENLEFEDSSFDYALCLEVIEHLPMPEKVISEIARVLKPGGKAAIATPDYSRKHWLIAEKFTPAKVQHINKFTRKSLEQMCRRHNLVPLGHKYVAGCDLVELFGKSHNGNGQYSSSKLQVIGTGVEVIKRIAKPSISRANFAITYKCNQQCKTCNIWQKYHREPERIKDEVTLEEFQRILENNNLMWLSLTGGEPFLRNDIGEILETCLDKLKVTSIVTNGSKPEYIEKSVRKALANSKGIITLNVSLEGEEKAHDSVAGREDSWENAIETLNRLSSVNCSRLKLGIEHLLSTYTKGQVEHIKQIADCLGISITYTMEQNSPFYEYHDEVGSFERPKTKVGSNPIDLAAFLFSYKASREKKIKCVAGEYSCFIDPYCTVYPCLFYTPTYPLVNLRETGYKIGRLNCKELTEKCEGCWTPCEAYATMIFRPWRLL